MPKHLFRRGYAPQSWDISMLFRVIRLPWFMSFLIGTVIFILLSSLMNMDNGQEHVSNTSTFSRWFAFDDHSSKHLRVTTTSPSRDPMPRLDVKQIKKILKTIDDYLSSFVDKLINIRTIHLKNLQKNEWIPIPETTELLDADNHRFLTQIRNLKILQTITINISLDDFLTKLPWTGYEYGSNNCNLMEARSEYGNTASAHNGGFGKRYYKTSCQENVTSLIKQIPFERNILDIGYLPLLRPRTEEPGNVVALTYLHVVKNAVVHMDGDVFVGKYKLVPQRCLAAKHTGDKPEDEGFLHLYEEVFTIAQFWGEGFFHFMNEELPRLAAWVPFLRRYPEIKIHVNSVQPFIPPVFLALGLDTERIVAGHVRAQLVYIPAGTPCGAQTFFNSKLLSLRLQENVINKPTIIHSILFKPRNRTLDEDEHSNSSKNHKMSPSLVGNSNKSSRKYIVLIQRSTKRYFEQHDAIFEELLKLADEHNLKVRLFDDKKLPNYPDTVEMFHNAVAIVGPHGAGMSNMFFSQPGTIVIEGLCYHSGFANLCYRNLAKNLGLRYYGVILNEDCLSVQASDLITPLRKFLVAVHLGKR